MANWCLNEIKIEGEELYLDKLKKKINDYRNLSKKNNKILFMEYMVGLGDIPADYNENVGEVKKERFGTRCDMGLTELEFTMEDGSILIVADSRWYPILPFVSKLCKKYSVSAIVGYYERLGAFGGRAIIDNSGNVKDSVHPYMEAIFLYDTGSFWKELDYHVENIKPEYFEEFIRDQTYLGEKEINRIILEYDVRKYNL